MIYEAVLLGILSGMGVLGNILIVLACAFDKNLRQYTDVFVINVAIFDMLVSGVLFPSMVALAVYEENIYPDSVCSFLGALTILTCTGSIFSLTVVAINRSIYICHNAWYKRLFTKKTVTVMLASVWCYCIGIMLPTLLGWGGVGYQERVPMCCFDHRHEITYTFFLFLVALGVPLVITFVSYIRIFLVMYRSRSRVTAHDNSAQKSKNTKKYVQVLTMFAVSASFTLFWLPYCIVCVVDYYTYVHPTIVKVVTWLGLANSCINSFILGTVNKNYHAAYKRLLCSWRRQKGIQPVAEATVESSTTQRS